MDLPSYNFLPAPLWLITALHIVTLTFHFVAMNFLFGGLIVLLFGRMDNKWQDPTVGRFIKFLPTAVAATVTLGVAPLLFLQLVYYNQVYSATITSAWFWLAVIDAVIIGYYCIYGSAFSMKKRPERAPVLLTVAFVALLFVSLVYSTIMSMAERPDIYVGVYANNQSGLLINPEIGSWLFRWLHMLTGAVAVGVFFVGLLGRDNEPAYNLGKGFFLWGTAGAMALGFVYLFTLGDYIVAIMRSPVIWAITAALVLSLGALHLFFKKKFVGAGLLVLLSLIGMVTARHVLRLIVLEGRFNPARIPVNPQWLVFLVFLVFFVIAIGLVWYMVRLYFTDRGEAA